MIETTRKYLATAKESLSAAQADLNALRTRRHTLATRLEQDGTALASTECAALSATMAGEPAEDLQIKIAALNASIGTHTTAVAEMEKQIAIAQEGLADNHRALKIAETQHASAEYQAFVEEWGAYLIAGLPILRELERAAGQSGRSLNAGQGWHLDVKNPTFGNHRYTL